jgi:hypothetical protein
MSSIAGFWEKFDKKLDAINRSALILKGDSSLIDGISAYKLYINRNVYITGARFANLAPPNSIYTKLKAGLYTIVLREYDVSKLDRKESNILPIEICDNEQIMIRASLQNEQLILYFDNEV